MRHVNISRFSVPAALAIGLGLAACGTPSLNMTKLEANIKTAATEAFAGRTVGSVTCPSSKDIKVAAGVTFECQVTVDDATGAFLVTQDDAKGKVSYKQLDAFLDRVVVETKIGADISTQVDAQVTVSCGNAKVMTYAVGETFVCKATDGESTNDVKLTVTDAAGNVKWEVV
jgi:Domain of unknown function (DUF4333)